MLTDPSFIAIKPDGVQVSIEAWQWNDHGLILSQRGIVGEILSRFERRGYKLVAIKLTAPGKEHLEKHYEDLKDKPFFSGLVSCEHA